MNLSIGDESFIVDGKALYWPRTNSLIVADVHLGKSTYFQVHGMALPQSILHHELDTLSAVMERHRAERLLVLGDLFHHEDAFVPSFINDVTHWREQMPWEILLIEGNHDRRVRYPEHWGIMVEGDLDWENFSFRHEWDERAPWFQLTGHFHPALALGRGADRVRVPCYWLRQNGMVLPAFTGLSGHYNVQLAPDERAILVTNEGVLPFP